MASLARALRLVGGVAPLRRVAEPQRLLQPVRRSTSGQEHVVCIPSRNKPSKAEFVILGSVMLVCWLSIPTWVLLHISEYNGTAPKK